jgi:hypothetical protein
MKGKTEFKEFTDEEIHAEIYRRNRERLKPKKLYNAVEHIKDHYYKLINICEEYINNIAEGNHVGSDDEHFVFEEAIKAVYGKDIFIWINNNT